METIKCYQCHAEKERSEFDDRPDSKRGHRRECSKCTRENTAKNVARRKAAKTTLAAVSTPLALSNVLTPLGLNLPDNYSRDEFEILGRQLGEAERGIQWAIGDFYNAIDWGDKADVCEELGINPRTAETYAGVAGMFQIPRRLGISFSHHHAVMCLPVDEQDALLAECIGEDGKTTCSVRDIKAEARIRANGGQQPPTPPAETLPEDEGAIFQVETTKNTLETILEALDRNSPYYSLAKHTIKHWIKEGQS